MARRCRWCCHKNSDERRRGKDPGLGLCDRLGNRRKRMCMGGGEVKALQLSLRIALAEWEVTHSVRPCPILTSGAWYKRCSQLRLKTTRTRYSAQRLRSTGSFETGSCGKPKPPEAAGAKLRASEERLTTLPRPLPRLPRSVCVPTQNIKQKDVMHRINVTTHHCFCTVLYCIIQSTHCM